MSSTLDDLRTDTRQFLDETDSSNSSFSDAELNRYLNKSARKTAVLLEIPIAIYTASTVTSQALYTLPAGTLFVVEIHLDGKKIDVVERTDMEGLYPEWQNADDGAPVVAYRQDNLVFGLHPPPDSSHASKTIEAHVIKLPEDLSDDADVPDLHEILQDCLPIRAAMYAMLRAGNFKAADYFRQLFKEEIADAKSKMNKFAEDTIGLRWA